MEKRKNKIRFCKKCQKPLTEGDKYKYCESCRNGQVETAKKVFTGIGATAGTALAIVVAVATKGKIKPKG